MRKDRYSIDALPELPVEVFEVAGTLAHAKRGPFLTIMPPAQPVPAPPKPPAVPLAPISSFEVRKYYTQAIYPRVICIDPGDLISDVAFDPTSGGGGGDDPRGDVFGRADLATLARREQQYKLTTLHGNRLHHALWCTVKYGPWLAVVYETESCITGEPNRWEFWIVEVPEVYMVWYGQWLDQPSLPNLTVIKGDLAPAGVSRQCCPGYHWCPTTQSCIPIQIECKPPVPV
jgi:hypothetical protein